MAFAKTAPLRSALAEALPERPFTVAFWDGTEVPATAPGPRFTVRSPRAVAHALCAPGQLGLGRAYVSGELEVDDIDAAIALLQTWKPPALDRAAKARLALAAARAMGLERPPRRPQSELVPEGRRHSIARDRRVGAPPLRRPDEFFALFLDESMTYSCAIFSRGATTLEEAQETKLELVCTQARPASRASACSTSAAAGAASPCTPRTTTASTSPASRSRRRRPSARGARAEEAGVADRVEIRVRTTASCAGERFDAIASIGMVEHVGNVQIDAYAAAPARPARARRARLLNHGIARLRHGDPEAGPFSERYVFPDAAPLHLSRVLSALERAGLPADHVEGFAADYAETLRHWAQRLDENLDQALELAGPERVRVWRLYLRAARNGFETGFTSIYQVRAAPAGVVLAPVGTESATVSA